MVDGTVGDVLSIGESVTEFLRRPGRLQSDDRVVVSAGAEFQSCLLRRRGVDRLQVDHSGDRVHAVETDRTGAIDDLRAFQAHDRRIRVIHAVPVFVAREVVAVEQRERLGIGKPAQVQTHIVAGRRGGEGVDAGEIPEVITHPENALVLHGSGRRSLVYLR